MEEEKLKEYLNKLDKDALIELYFQQRFDKAIEISMLKAKLAENESELEKQKEKYDKLYGCYKKTASEDLQDKYRLVEENKQLKQQLAVCEKEHELLINQFEEETEKLRKQIKQESDARKRFVKEVENLKQKFDKDMQVTKLKKKNLDLKNALLLTLQNVNKESCYYCPFGCKDECSYEEDSEECILCLYKKAIAKVRSKYK